MTDVQKKLKDATLKQPMCKMMGAPEVLQLNANLMQSIGAKKVGERQRMQGRAGVLMLHSGRSWAR